jgi:hypothetical protein
VYVRTRIDELPATLAHLAMVAGLSVNTFAEAVLCRQLGIDHPHTDTVRRTLLKAHRPQQTPLPLE